MTYNASQSAAIACPAKNIVVLAGPGSGKTHMLIGRCLNGPVPAEETTIITYTTAAAKVIQDRLAQAGRKAAFVGTVHAWLFSLLRKQGRRVSIADEETASALLQEVADQQRYKGTKAQLEDAKEARWNVDLNPNSPAGLVVAAYRRRLKESNLLDFDDILFEGSKFLLTSWIGGQLLWDEFQDTSSKLLTIFERAPFPVKMAVGDPNQSIFSFLGGNCRNILAAASQGAQVIRLAENYRCPKEVCDVANRLIAHNGAKERTEPATEKPGTVEFRTFPDARAEVLFIAQRCNALAGKSAAVLLRTNKAVEEVSLQLEGFGVKLDRKQRQADPPGWKLVKALVSALGDPYNPVLAEKLVRAWKPDDAATILYESVSRMEPLLDFCLFLPICDTAQEAVAFVLTKKPGDEASKRLQDALTLLPATATPSDLLLCLHEAGAAQGSPDSAAVTVSTMHSAKGREFDVVFVPMLEKGVFPTDAEEKNAESLAESRRLCYVAVTRAASELHLSRAEKRKPAYGGRWSGEKATEPSRFWSELAG